MNLKDRRSGEILDGFSVGIEEESDFQRAAYRVGWEESASVGLGPISRDLDNAQSGQVASACGWHTLSLSATSPKNGLRYLGLAGLVIVGHLESLVTRDLTERHGAVVGAMWRRSEVIPGRLRGPQIGWAVCSAA